VILVPQLESNSVMLLLVSLAVLDFTRATINSAANSALLRMLLESGLRLMWALALLIKRVVLLTMSTTMTSAILSGMPTL